MTGPAYVPASLTGTTTLPLANKTSTYTIDNEDCVINCTSGTFTVTLPTAVGISGQYFVIKNSGSGVVTIDANASETIDGAPDFTLSTQYESVTVISNGANWAVI
jgi:hypothetical protein